MNNDAQEPPKGDPINSFSADSREKNHPVVLIVEDHDDTREMLTILLSSFGCHVVGAEDGERAMNVAERSRPDLILLDIKMPRLDGLAVARLIRSHPSLNKVPIVAVTGYGTPQQHREVLRAGCNHCLVKPIDFDQLEKLIEVLVRSAPRQATIRSRYSLVVRSKGVMCSYHFH
ncbi:MAG TPA: response regulator [Pyrinomonadaceae bacterium]|nr:response regulator [Pyrinomonadaceae bacterium]